MLAGKIARLIAKKMAKTKARARKLASTIPSN